MAADGRDSLDHLQRASKQQPQKKRAPQVTPIGEFSCSITLENVLNWVTRIFSEKVFAHYGFFGISSDSEGITGAESGIGVLRIGIKI